MRGIGPDFRDFGKANRKQTRRRGEEEKRRRGAII